jgi:hypothetical protein
MSKKNRVGRRISSVFLVGLLSLITINLARAEGERQIESFTESKLIVEGARYLGTSAENMAEVVSRLFSDYGPPDAVIRGEEVSAAIMLGLRYGRGDLLFPSGEIRPIYWRGPSAGIDTGGNAAKSFALIYNLKNPEELYSRFVGIEGSAFYLGGISVNFLQRNETIVAPMRVGVGIRLGANIGYVKFSPTKGWFPF